MIVREEAWHLSNFDIKRKGILGVDLHHFWTFFPKNQPTQQPNKIQIFLTLKPEIG